MSETLEPGRSAALRTDADVSPLLATMVADIAAGQGFPVQLGPGESTEPFRLEADRLPALLVEALVAGGPERVVWVSAGSELLVEVPATQVEVLDGMLVVGLRVACEQTGEGDLSVVLAVGAEPTGVPLMVVSGVFGPPLLQLRWAEAAAAAASAAVLRVGVAAAAATGPGDRPGRRNRLASLWAEPGTLLLAGRTPYDWELTR
jgi:hypothetical protein